MDDAHPGGRSGTDLGLAASKSAEHLRSLRVLVLDEMEITRRVLALVLDALGVSVTLADNLSEALAHLSVRRFDAILTDAEMPGVALRGGRAVLAGIAGPNAMAPVFSIDGRVHDAFPEPAHAAGMVVEIGGAIDPARICRELESLAPRPPNTTARAA